MAPFCSRFFLHFFSFLFFYASLISLSFSTLQSDFSILHLDSDHQDYSPHALTSVACTDLGGVGSLDSTCKIFANLNIIEDIYIQGKGNFYILPGVRFLCPFLGCSITLNIGGNFSLGENSTIVIGTFDLTASNASFFNGSAGNTTGLAGDPPAQTSGTPQGVDGAGGGHGGRGASCVVEEGKLPEDVWGGDPYSWSTLQHPWSHGSKGGTTSKEVDYGGGGGGRVKLQIKGLLEVNGSLLADGGDGGSKGGGGSGGSIHIIAHTMIGGGRISASGGNGFAGGSGGRVAADVFSRHGEPKIYVHGGTSRGCPENAGAAGTLYDAVPRSLTVNNHNLTTVTETVLLQFPSHPLWTNVYIKNCARATVPLLQSRIQVQRQISLLYQGVLSFGLAHYAASEFELFAEELLMSDSVIKVYGVLRMTLKIFLMWNSKVQINGGEDSTFVTSRLEESSVIKSNANLGLQGQGLLNFSRPGDNTEAQRLDLSLFYRIHVGPGSVLHGPPENASSDAVLPKLYCELQDFPIELLHPLEDCSVNSSLSFTFQICGVENITVEGLIKGSVGHFHRARNISVQSSGMTSASGTVLGSMEHPLSSLSVEGAVRGDGESSKGTWQQEDVEAGFES